jgi:integrase
MKAQYLDLDKKMHKRLPFTTDQLKVIFGSPLFHRCAGDGYEHEPGDTEIRDWRYWIPIIALYTGARLGEIAQLLTVDVRCDAETGYWIFHITTEGSAAKSTKTEGSERVVPVHSRLIDLGLLAYHENMQRQNESQLFPQLRPDARGFFSGTASKFFNSYFHQIGAKTDKQVNFHSFRHGMADALRKAGFIDLQFGVLLGHGKSTMTGKYGVVPQGILLDRVRMIEAVKFPELETLLRSKTG